MQKNGSLTGGVLVGGPGRGALCQLAGGPGEHRLLGLGVLVAAVSWFQMRLEDRERLEKLELDELAKTHGGSALFEAQGRGSLSRRNGRASSSSGSSCPALHRCSCCCCRPAEGFCSGAGCRRARRVLEVTQPTVALALFGLFALVLFLLGRFSATIARLEHHRLLRPGASYLLFSAYPLLVRRAGHGRCRGRVPQGGFLCRARPVRPAGAGRRSRPSSNWSWKSTGRGSRARSSGPCMRAGWSACWGSRKGSLRPRRRPWITSSGSRSPKRGSIASSRRRSDGCCCCKWRCWCCRPASCSSSAGEQGLLEHFGKPVGGPRRCSVRART